MGQLRKLLLGIGAVLAAVIVLFGVLRLIGGIGYYTVSSGANAPAIKLGSHVLSTLFKGPDRNDFICYKAVDEMTGEKATFIHRLAAKEGDKVEIKDGVLFVNDRCADDGLILNNAYRVSREMFAHLQGLDADIEGGPVDDGSFAVIFTVDSFMRNHNVGGIREVYSKDKGDEYIAKKWHQPWNADQFGPVIVPPHSYFVIGDNRHNSADSRYRGFISEADYKSTVLWK